MKDGQSANIQKPITDHVKTSPDFLCAFHTNPKLAGFLHIIEWCRSEIKKKCTILFLQNIINSSCQFEPGARVRGEQIVFGTKYKYYLDSEILPKTSTNIIFLFEKAEYVDMNIIQVQKYGQT